MRILFITGDFSGASLCRRLADEGNDVRALVDDSEFLSILDGVVEKVPFDAAGDLSAHLGWLGQDGLIVVDDSGFGQLQDDLRAAGYAVVGGCAGADRLEEDRLFSQEVLKRCGIRTLPIHHFQSVPEAIDFLEARRGRWVLKHNGYPDKAVCYAGQLDSAEDLLDLLRRSISEGYSSSHVVLQRYIDGVEMSVARYFNGTDWIGLAELNVEHKKLFPGDLGPNTYEMGNLLWYENSPGRLFNEVLNPLKAHLQKIGFHGDMDVNCIINADGAWPLELTPRFGYPATELQIELHESRWTDFLLAVAKGQDFDLAVSPGYAVAVLVAAPPFPCKPSKGTPWLSLSGLRIHFREPVSQDELAHYHFEEACRLLDATWEICHDSGYVLHVTGHGLTVEAAREAANRRAANVVIPRAFYRTDIGERFVHESYQQLKHWGYV
ncbi:MAG: hypothetical protein WC334_02780 [Kiritimatiellales bacterium]